MTCSLNQKVKGMISREELSELVDAGEIESVVIGFTDHYGRLCGKRFVGSFFLENPHTACCNYLLAVDMDMNPVPGFEHFNWEKGYGDFMLLPDWSTLRVASWMDKTALVLGDVVHEETKELIPFAPRSILKKQLSAMEDLDLAVNAAPELEYYVFQQTYRQAHDGKYMNLKPLGYHVEDYQLLQANRAEPYHGQFRRHLIDSGVPVENTKGEAGLGQHELNVRYGPCLTMADRHVVYKQCLKEVAEKCGVSVTFMAKPSSDQSGSSCHVHFSLWKNGKNAFADDGESKALGNTSFFHRESSKDPVIDFKSEYGFEASNTFRWFLGGWLYHAHEFMVFFAPTVNSYKRYVSESWAPTKVSWCRDNRTAGYRVVGDGSSLRIECRVPGADANIYLAFAALLASGLDGLKHKIEPPHMFEGDIYAANQLPEVPKTLGEASTVFAKSDFARTTLGDDVHGHYAHHFKSELQAYEKAVTDWELARYFERI
eukprot:Nk52_evm50s554 gene=Nk52_evmTU50s554